MTFTFHPKATEELSAAIDYYDSCKPGLGTGFAEEFELCVSNILTNPKAWPLIDTDIRRCLLRRF